MPGLTQQNGNLVIDGPLVEALIAVPAAVEQQLRAEGSPIPTPVRVKMMIDTGATGTVLSQGVVAPLGLNPVGVTPISTPSSQGHPCNRYFVRMSLQNGLVLEHSIIEAPMPGQNIGGLIGRDILSVCTFIYIGYAGVFSLNA